MQRETKSLIWGVILIVIGMLFLGQNLGWFYFHWHDFWPSAMIAGGLFFWIGWLANRKEFGLLMPGTILLVYGIMFQYSALEGWYYMDRLWPGFMLGPGLGFLFMYLLGNREKGLLIPAFILIALSLLFWLGEDALHYFWPLILIALGLFLLMKSRRPGSVEISETEAGQTEGEQENPPK